MIAKASVDDPTPPRLRESETIKVLLVDDDVHLIEEMAEFLGREGFRVEAITQAAAALVRITSAISASSRRMPLAAATGRKPK